MHARVQCYSHASECLERQEKWAKASVYRDRHLRLAVEAASKEEEAKAYAGLGEGKLAMGRFRCAHGAKQLRRQRVGAHFGFCRGCREALSAFEAAEECWDAVKHEVGVIACLKWQARVCDRLQRFEKSAEISTHGMDAGAADCMAV